MKTMTARDAKIHFGEFLDTMQREPVLVTKNNRPVGIMISIEDAADTLIPEMFMEKDEGYDAWFQAKVTRTLDAFHSGKTTTSSHEEVMGRLRQKLQLKPDAP
ncbi:MAG: type II toxin-antitoxin system prevent-host-death family antitoxin [Gammaproteobacteria bacterium]|nr:type II toxin-antitoxin system prevent-host-death family antitoxin [Gammaproteobacteria bacterium]MBU1655259.1 type II toxin-antitoxin system prevent-host-death family antitoxin [Gammaproteobacteria bacterium]MBU1962038.1 type II toxin-antitoxin system prevent-host-death family antitoxin [Gammaproteobacteria bacterium]